MINLKMHFNLMVVSPFSAFQERRFHQKSEINDLNVNLPSQKLKILINKRKYTKVTNKINKRKRYVITTKPFLLIRVNIRWTHYLET